MNLQDLKQNYQELEIKKNLTGKEALEAVKQDGDALRYVDSKFFSETNLSGKEVEVKIDDVIYKAIIK